MKRITVILVFSFIVIASYGQYNYNKYNYYSVGVKLGPDFYSYTIDDGKNADIVPEFNFSLGVSGAYYVTWNFEVHAAIYYSRRKFAIDWNYPGISIGLDPKVRVRSDHYMNYINIPIEARINALYLSWMKLNFGVGIMPDFRFKPREKTTYNTGDIVDSDQYWGSKHFTRILIAFPLSMNLKFYLSRHITIEASAYYYLYVNRMHKKYLTKPGNAIAPRLGVFYEW